MRWTGRGAGGRGSVLVEAALILPVFILLLVAVAELSRAWLGYSLVTHAVRKAARLASVTPNLQPDQQEILDQIEATLGHGGFETAASSVTLLEAGRLVQVSAEVRFEPVVSFVLPNAAEGGIPLRAQVVTRYEI